MNTLMIFLTQTKTAAIIEILLLLLVAAIIGYIVAWLYYKSIYTKIIKGLESEKEQLNNQIVKLNDDNSKLKKSLREKDDEIGNLMEEINTLKGDKTNRDS
jgi:peptidoglycan hydrolase CwlO-like protein